VKVERWCTATRRSLTGAPRPVLLDRCSCPIARLSLSWEATTIRTGVARTTSEQPGHVRIGTGRGAPPPVYTGMVDTLLTYARARAVLHHHCFCLPSLRRHARRRPWKRSPPRPWWAVPRLV
jgi:hypothetical protein